MRPKIVKNYYPKMFGSIWDRKLFTWKEFETLINIRPLMTDARVHIQTEDPNQEWEWVNSAWQHDMNCFPPSLLRTLINECGIFYLTDMSRYTSKINDIARCLEEENGTTCDAHIYVCRNTDKEHVFGTHFDRNDNVIVQCEGKTNFKIWNEVDNPEELRKNGMSTKMSLTEDPMLDVDMNPGDAIWIPKSYPHLASSKSRRMSISFPLASSGTSIDQRFQDRNWIKL